MKRLIFIFPLTLSLLFSCEKKQPEASSQNSSEEVVKDNFINKDSSAEGTFIKYAHSYNNFITDNQGYIIEKNILFTHALESNAAPEELSGLYKSLLEQTQVSIDSVQKLGSFNGNVEYKEAAISLFKFYLEAWGEYKGLIDLKTKEERVKVYEKLKTKFNDAHSKTEKVLEDKFVQAHTNFANSNELHVRKTGLHEKLDSILYLK